MRLHVRKWIKDKYAVAFRGATWESRTEVTEVGEPGFKVQGPVVGISVRSSELPRPAVLLHK